MSAFESKESIAVVAAVVRRGDRYLVCQRAAGQRHAGLWEFPGGKLEAGESLLDAARRELAEELALEIEGGAAEALHSARDPASPYVIHFLEVQAEGEPRCREHQALRWCALEELGELELAPSDASFVAWLAATE